MSIVILSGGSSMIIVVVCVVIYVVSIILKTRKKYIDQMIKKTPQQNIDRQSDTVVDSTLQDHSGNMPLPKKKRHQRRQKNGGEMDYSAEGMQSVEPAEEEPIAIANDVLPESKYSLKNLDEAKRAIVYYEILKPKF